MRPNRTVLALAAAALLTVTACSGEFVEARSEADTTALVQRHADEIAALVGAPLLNPKTGPMSCGGGRENYAVQGVYNIETAGGEQVRIAAGRVRADWTAKGYTVTDDREVGTYDVVVAAKTPDGFGLDLESVAPDAFAVILHSPCFSRPS